MPRTSAASSLPSEEELRHLASFEAAGAPVLSLYLNTDGRRFPRRGDYEVHLTDLVRRARSTHGLDREAARSLEADLDRVTEFVRKEFDRGKTRGLAFFACSGAGLWHLYRLPVAVRGRVAVDRHPHVLRLEFLLARAETFATVLINRERARLFTARLGDLRERTEVLDEVPGKHGKGGWAQARFSRHIEEMVHKHLKHVAEVAFALSKAEPFDRVVLAGPEEVVATFEKGLHPWLADRVCARVTLPMNASRDRVAEATVAVEEIIETERSSDAVSRVLEEFAAGRAAVVGVDRTLAALTQGRVETLVVSDGEARPGWRCAVCGLLATRDGKCPACGAGMLPVADLGEEMVDEALRRRCQVVTAETRPLPEGVGALLRF
jgi:peptide chain release factor subunit 1